MDRLDSRGWQATQDRDRLLLLVAFIATFPLAIAGKAIYGPSGQWIALLVLPIYLFLAWRPTKMNRGTIGRFVPSSFASVTSLWLTLMLVGLLAAAIAAVLYPFVDVFL
jgi:hypothetical protein